MVDENAWRDWGRSAAEKIKKADEAEPSGVKADGPQ